MVNLLVHIVTLILLKKKGEGCYNVYYATRDAYVITSLWGIRLSSLIRHLEHVWTL